MLRLPPPVPVGFALPYKFRVRGAESAAVVAVEVVAAVRASVCSVVRAVLEVPAFCRPTVQAMTMVVP